MRLITGSLAAINRAAKAAMGLAGCAFVLLAIAVVAVIVLGLAADKLLPDTLLTPEPPAAETMPLRPHEWIGPTEWSQTPEWARATPTAEDTQ